jgi:hypothetical protein
LLYIVLVLFNQQFSHFLLKSQVLAQQGSLEPADLVEVLHEPRLQVWVMKALVNILVALVLKVVDLAAPVEIRPNRSVRTLRVVSLNNSGVARLG